MKNTEMITESITLMDEVFKNKGRQNIIGTLITGTGLTITAVGMTILMNKPENVISEPEKA